MHEEAKVGMKRLIQNLLLVLMLGVASVGAFAQKRDDDKRPPKPPARVVTQEKKGSPPPQNSNKSRPDPKKKP